MWNPADVSSDEKETGESSDASDKMNKKNKNNGNAMTNFGFSVEKVIIHTEPTPASAPNAPPHYNSATSSTNADTVLEVIDITTILYNKNATYGLLLLLLFQVVWRRGLEFVLSGSPVHLSVVREQRARSGLRELATELRSRRHLLSRIRPLAQSSPERQHRPQLLQKHIQSASASASARGRTRHRSR